MQLLTAILVTIAVVSVVCSRKSVLIGVDFCQRFIQFTCAYMYLQCPNRQCAKALSCLAAIENLFAVRDDVADTTVVTHPFNRLYT